MHGVTTNVVGKKALDAQDCGEFEHHQWWWRYVDWECRMCGAARNRDTGLGWQERRRLDFDRTGQHRNRWMRVHHELRMQAALGIFVLRLLLMARRNIPIRRRLQFLARSNDAFHRAIGTHKEHQQRGGNRR